MSATEVLKVAIEPASRPEFEAAVAAAGGQVVELDSSVRAMIWTDYSKPAELDQVIRANPQLEWVQLPFAGVDAFTKTLQAPVQFTSAKGSYKEPVAEHALTLALALARKIPERVRASTWGEKFAVSLYDSEILIVGGGGITEELLKLLAPFKTTVRVLRKHVQPMHGATSVEELSALDERLATADFVVLAAALTDETRGLFDADRFSKMQSTAYLVNIARGPIVDTPALVSALNDGLIAGAGVDVTDPEPLPDGHPLWAAKNVIITPHTADTPVQVIRLFSERIDANVKAFITGQPLIGLVDPSLGY
ncbi:MAG: NAD(P)-dependent oxidoreductase [Rhodoluna sp.]